VSEQGVRKVRFVFPRDTQIAGQAYVSSAGKETRVKWFDAPAFMWEPKP
jgi:hypothetical protein